MQRIIMGMLIITATVGCNDYRYNNPSSFEKAVDACIRTGGIPITGMWNTLERCDAPPNCVQPDWRN